jgi:hypothetical protein
LSIATDNYLPKTFPPSTIKTNEQGTARKKIEFSLFQLAPSHTIVNQICKEDRLWNLLPDTPVQQSKPTHVLDRHQKRRQKSKLYS